MGIQLFNVRDTAEHAHVVEMRRNEVSHLRHGPTPLQRARKLGLRKAMLLYRLLSQSLQITMAKFIAMTANIKRNIVTIFVSLRDSD